jgi:putative membrane protein
MHVMRGRGVSAFWMALTAPATVWLLHGVALWIWHMPALYDAALRSESVHAIQHLCFFLSASLFWWGIAHGRYGRAGYGAAVVYVFATAMHSGVLGALLTFSTHVWYPVYAQSGHTLGLSPLEDQQLAGLLMWIPAGITFIVGGLYFFAAWLKESERRVAHAAR